MKFLMIKAISVSMFLPPPPPPGTEEKRAEGPEEPPALEQASEEKPAAGELRQRAALRNQARTNMRVGIVSFAGSAAIATVAMPIVAYHGIPGEPNAYGGYYNDDVAERRLQGTFAIIATGLLVTGIVTTAIGTRKYKRLEKVEISSTLSIKF